MLHFGMMVCGLFAQGTQGLFVGEEGPHSSPSRNVVLEIPRLNGRKGQGQTTANKMTWKKMHGFWIRSHMFKSHLCHFLAMCSWFHFFFSNYQFYLHYNFISCEIRNNRTTCFIASQKRMSITQDVKCSAVYLPQITID